MKINSIKIMSAVALGLLFQAANAGSITDINVSVLPNKQRVIKFKFDSGVVEPSGFITSAPARIALDFPATDIKVSQSQLTFNDQLLKQIIAAQGSEHARVLLGLGKEGQYSTEIKGNEVWVYLSEAESTNTAAVAAAQSVVSSAPKNSQSYQSSGITAPFNIDFHKGANRSGVIEYSSNYSGQPQMRVQSDRLIILLKDYPLSVQDQRNLDVTDFSTPVRTINVRRIGNDAQIIIRSQGTWEHKVSGRNGRQTIHIVPTKNISTIGLSRKNDQKFTGKNVSLDFQNVDVRTVLQILATESGMNIVASDNVTGKMTLSLKDVPWDQALDLILDARNLDMRKVGNIINIAPRSDLLARDTEALEAQRKLDDLGPLISQSFQLKYKNVEEFRKILRISDSASVSSDRNSILSSRGSALIDPATNTLIVTDVQSVITKFNKLIEELDVPSRQVMIEARIVEAADGFSRDLGVQFGYQRSGAHTSVGSNWSNSINNANVGYGSATSSILNPNVALPSSASTSSIGIVRAVSSGALGLELSASESENRSKTISTPRVLTQDRQEAEIRQGYQIPYTKREDGETSIEWKAAELVLKTTPRITPDNKVILDIEIKKDEPDGTYTAITGEAGLATRYVKTQAMIEDGGTLVVGGIYQEATSNSIRKVPLLGDIPVVGNLFKARARKSSRNELLFFITPRIMGSETSVLRY
ncbi:type IV pilus secretin PilQ [Wielerella bovis]|uniref:type IV pilus secretin PilQ n=1 Tax=Wielerella bovis TaxID=2917790 RepID=UPI00201849D0|nr:type IV pilus secretin PilQ [Wielerella bovis]ULJ63607.1 type IV pilus secretin PilQ [Wielerella bovis]ULJ65822.1 type IV pilus secretin PilQ [Wielerella bovis]ULJ68249.1 type IV pilus secretin PilQ [Wielerella bovis]